jgi:hypothetical protein
MPAMRSAGQRQASAERRPRLSRQQCSGQYFRPYATLGAVDTRRKWAITFVLAASLIGLVVLCLLNPSLATISSVAAVVYVLIYGAGRKPQARRLFPFVLVLLVVGVAVLLTSQFASLPPQLQIRTLAATYIADVRAEDDGYRVKEQLSVDLKAVLDEPVDNTLDPFDKLPRDRDQLAAIIQERFASDGWVFAAVVDGRPSFTRSRTLPLNFDGLQLQQTAKFDLALPHPAPDVRLRADAASKVTLSTPSDMVVATKPPMSSAVAESRRRELRTLSLKDEDPLENSRLSELEVVALRGLLRNAVGKKILQVSLSGLAAGIVSGLVALVLAGFKKVISDEYIVPWWKRRFPKRPVPVTD